MQLQLRFGFVLVVGALIAAGCTVGDPGQDAGLGADTGLIPNIDGGQDSGTPPTCEPGEIDCGGTCSRVAEDSQNCGSCGNVCPTGFSCAIGRCDCAEPMKSCDGLCIDPSSDTMNCGSCGNACAAGETCLRGECITNCEDPLVRCQNTAADGSDMYVCADLQSDAMNCGRCDTRCAGGAVCQGGYCGCATGQVSCSGTCTNLATDANNCGGCLNSCGADGVCSGGTCTSCGAGLTACGSPRRCVDTSTSRLHCGACGNTCGPGEACNAGTCECLPGLVVCGDVCSNLDADVHNCGGCGIDCGRGGTCVAGVCSCATGTTMCGASCAVLSESHENCGACGNACAAEETCVSGDCVVLNNSCATAYVVTADVAFMDQATADGGSRPTGTGCGGGSGAEALYYAVTIPAGQEVAVTTSGVRGDLVLFELAACGNSSCAQASDWPEALTLTNVGTSDLMRIVGVRAYSSSTDATFDIRFTYSTPILAPNASCEGATPITANTTITGENTALGGPRSAGTGCGGGSGNKALYYAVTIPAGQQVDMTTTTSADLVVFEQAACGDAACAQSSDEPESLTLMNLGASDVTRIVGVRMYSSASSDIYTIQFAYSTPVVAPNATCAGATAITANTTITGENTALGGPRSAGTGCGNGSGNKALYYAVTIPAGQQVDMTTTTSADLVVFEQAACGDAACTQSSDTPQSLTLMNLGTSDVTRIVGVRMYSSSSSGTYTIQFTYSTPVLAPNATCATATAITADTTITGENTTLGGPRSAGTGCGFGSGNKALYYAVTIPPGQEVDMTTSTSADLVVFEQAACGDVDCAQSSDFPESLTLTNTGASDVTRIVGVRNYSSSSSTTTYSISFVYSTP